MIHAVIDTNVLVSALLTSKSDTATVQVLEAIMNGQIIPLYNEEIISEYEKSRKKKETITQDTRSNRYSRKRKWTDTSTPSYKKGC